MVKKISIRNSTAEFLIFTQQAGEGGIEVRYQYDTIWLTQKLMAELFNTSTNNIGSHLKNIYEENELLEGATTQDFLVVQKEGNRAHRKIPMTMEDWAKRLDQFLEFDEREILQHAGRISAEIAKSHAESEFEKYRILQDRLFESDFDKTLKWLEDEIRSNEER